MRLVYKETDKSVRIGDLLDDGRTVVYFRPPHKPSSSGKISLSDNREYFVGTIGAQWIEREDQS